MPKTPVGSGSASLLGGTQSRSLSQDGEDFFFDSDLNATQQARNSSGADARQFDLGPYFAEIRRRVKQNWQPSAPKNDRQTVLAFSIQRNGQITGLTVRKSSGSPQVDSDSLEAVKNAAPFAPLPGDFPYQEVNVEFNFNINIYR